MGVTRQQFPKLVAALVVLALVLAAIFAIALNTAASRQPYPQVCATVDGKERCVLATITPRPTWLPATSEAMATLEKKWNDDWLTKQAEVKE
jgi:hypothetical protein